MNFRDHFSRDSKGYAEYRPTYPVDLFAWLATVSPGKRLAWDVGTGNGQAALALADLFEHVIASDPSEKQIDAATRHPAIEYRLGGESAGLEDASADLITVAQALHWFDRHRFWNEVRRTSRQRGVIAVWCYELQQVSSEIDEVINRFYRETLDGYWAGERKLVESGYRTIEFPFEELEVPRFAMTTEWTLDQEVGYLGTWSAVGKYRKETGEDPIPRVGSELARLWGAGTRRIDWPLSVRAGRM